MAEWLCRDLSELDLVVLMINGVFIEEESGSYVMNHDCVDEMFADDASLSTALHRFRSQ
jgi:hypothetical protein